MCVFLARAELMSSVISALVMKAELGSGSWVGCGGGVWAFCGVGVV